MRTSAEEYSASCGQMGATAASRCNCCHLSRPPLAATPAADPLGGMGNSVTGKPSVSSPARDDARSRPQVAHSCACHSMQCFGKRWPSKHAMQQTTASIFRYLLWSSVWVALSLKLVDTL